ncbi:RNA polymerase sigma factor [Flavobacterium sp.]|uniref:RNA polymerase sigma factor n=1 Tax=Flavobacterium sp. TaxID=239 RepID=UPI0026122879|nr:RNA polymerase sigma factor [Flavobacterium sp.]
MTFLDDKHHIHQIIEGNTNAFAVLVNQYKDLVFTLSYKMLKNKEEAEEVSQDTFVKVFNSLRKFKGESKFSTWIYKITYNTCIDRLKKSKKDSQVVYIEDFNQHQIKTIEVVLDAIDEKERNQKIQECIQLLPSEDAFLLTLYYFDDQSIEDIAKVIGCNSNNVKIKLFRSRKKIASILKSQLEPEILAYYESERR